MTTVFCDCDDCYNNNDGRCELDAISMTGRMTGGGWLTLCDDYREINREDFEPQESEDKERSVKYVEKDSNCLKRINTKS